MDLVANPGRTRVVVTMEHCDKHGRPEVREACGFPLTGRRCVSRIVTELAVFDVDWVRGLTLVEVAEGVGVEEVRAKTGAGFEVAADLRRMW